MMQQRPFKTFKMRIWSESNYIGEEYEVLMYELLLNEIIFLINLLTIYNVTLEPLSSYI